MTPDTTNQSLALATLKHGSVQHQQAQVFSSRSDPGRIRGRHSEVPHNDEQHTARMFSSEFHGILPVLPTQNVRSKCTAALTVGLRPRVFPNRPGD